MLLGHIKRNPDKMATENFSWGAPRVVSEILMLG